MPVSAYEVGFIQEQKRTEPTETTKVLSTTQSKHVHLISKGISNFIGHDNLGHLFRYSVAITVST